MNKIKLLPQDLINIIAAGEVVERPSSVVKELLENSIDANSSVIRVNIEDYGKKLIEVVDNGVGMNEEDALMAFEQHATSKILSKEDLENINSLGFRGEALASISSVAGKVELETKREHSKSVSINILGSKKGKGISSKSDNGTRVSIHKVSKE